MAHVAGHDGRIVLMVRAHSAPTGESDLDELGAPEEPVRTFAAAHLEAHHVLSYADAFAVALAREVEAQVVTGDPEFEVVEDLVPVYWLGRTAPETAHPPPEG